MVLQLRRLAIHWSPDALIVTEAIAINKTKEAVYLSNAIAQKEVSQSERFMNKVIAQFGSGVGEVALTKFQQRLAQNYFIALDSVLKTAEQKRNEKYNSLPITWQNVNMEKLAVNVVSYARIGFDPALPNHINLIPFKNNNTKNYDIGFIEGYRGLELKAIKYGLDVPDYTVVEVVFSTDKFKSIKKDRNNALESYEFEITNDFNRGAIVGGFYYHMFTKAPEKNKLVTLSLKDIEKRKPDKASAEFWGGEKDIYANGQKTGEKEVVGGWYEKMVEKTIFRAAYGSITIDSQKIDDDYMNLKQAEMAFAESEAQEEVTQNANREVIDVTPQRPPEMTRQESSAFKNESENPVEQTLAGFEQQNHEAGASAGTDSW
ncbi:recombinational DNA repair protein (RecE pathway) [Paenibacillus sp. LMG 31456]|uniref:Recombinational DNA repair protein (RecE pathway) n=1 Tax=Paenibacillus foliorum TaxID=2654974 RepID=A0A972GT07_9BACL|nr:recombinational DNA repair protein (RecE pathway) [Paenibacillus foliorum]